jgi:putative ABC transport system permease protein
MVDDVKYAGLDKPDEGTVYWPMPGRGVPVVAGTGTPFRNVVVRTTVDPATMVPAVREVVRELDPTLPVSSVATIDDLVAQAMQQPRALSMLVGGFALVALLLSVIGIYGVMVYYVQQHAKEIGIRLALGSSPGGVLRLIVRQGMTIVVMGVAIGVAAAMLVARWLSTVLFGIAATDALTFVAVTSLLLAIALVACCMPASRAIGIEPAAILRNDA